ncbi:MAG TPA: NADH dehydrogenase (quinone) subunit D [Candidatus Eisenbacteria bacterium]|jgi:NADH-quinone oxidoreductase subunit D|nr:NADH dehydrogenase (quinone) subunit D [Candidatus Eisenbacteria bacterium]
MSATTNPDVSEAPAESLQNPHFDTLTINMGPQHPSTHGVLRLILQLDGEIVVGLRPVMGYLHTGMEKIMESKTYTKSITVTDRMDYMSPLGNNMAYVGAVEQILGIDVPERARTLRIILLETMRISSHLVWLGTHALDLGAMSVFLYCFREREKLLDLNDMVAGSRMTPSYFRVGGFYQDVPDTFVPALRKFLDEFPGALKEYQNLLTKNRIFMQRTIGVGVLTGEQAVDLGCTGGTLRGSGVNYDVRKAKPYLGYETYDFEIPLGKNGDVYDRYLVRIEEMKQSLRIIRQALDRLKPGSVRSDYPYLFPAKREDVKRGMEELIFHFKIMSEGFRVPPGDAYFAIEAPKGELGFYVVADGSPKPYRVHVRPPSFIHLMSLEPMAVGRLVSDVIACIGSIDIVLGEVDR